MASAPSPLIWRGSSGGRALEWSTQGLRVSGGPRTIDLFAKPQGYADCEVSVSYRLLSVVGAIVSYERSDGADCKVQAHPSYSTVYSAVDAAHGGQEVNLTGLFAEDDILRALLGDRLVRAALTDAGLSPPSSLKALVNALAHEVSSPCEYAFDAGLLYHFAFHHIERRDAGRTYVAVRLGLSHGCEAARGNLTQLGVLLPLDRSPAALVDALRMAERRTEGFLMSDAQSIAGDRSTELEVGDEPPPPPEH